MLETDNNVEEEASLYFQDSDMENVKPQGRRRLKLSLDFLKANPLAFRLDASSESSTLPSPFDALIRPPSLESSSISSTSSETVGSSSKNSSSSSPPRVVVVPIQSSPMASSNVSTTPFSQSNPEPSAPKHNSSIRRFWDEEQEKQHRHSLRPHDEESSGDDCPSCGTEDSLDYSIPSLLDEEEEMFFSKMIQNQDQAQNQQEQDKDRKHQPIHVPSQRIVFVRGPDGYTKAVAVPAENGNPQPRQHKDLVRFGASHEDDDSDGSNDDCNCFLKLPPMLGGILNDWFGQKKTPVLTDNDAEMSAQRIRAKRQMNHAATRQRQHQPYHQQGHRYHRQPPQHQHSLPLFKTASGPHFMPHPHHGSGSHPVPFHHGTHQIPAFAFGRPAYYATHPGYH